MTEASEAPEGIDGAKVGAWLEANVAGASGPFTYALETLTGNLPSGALSGCN